MDLEKKILYVKIILLQNLNNKKIEFILLACFVQNLKFTP